MTRQETLAVLSAQNPEEKGFFFTSDDQAFTEKNLNLADNHAKTLSDNSIEWLDAVLTVSEKAEEVEEVEEVPAPLTKQKGKKAKAEPAPDEPAPADESAPEESATEPAPESAPADESAPESAQ